MKISSPEVKTTSHAVLGTFVWQYEWYDFSQSVFSNLPAVFPNIYSGVHFYFSCFPEEDVEARPFHIETFRAGQEAPVIQPSPRWPYAPFRLFRVVFRPGVPFHQLLTTGSAEEVANRFPDQPDAFAEWREVAGRMQPHKGLSGCVPLIESHLARKINSLELEVSPIIGSATDAASQSADMRVQELADIVGVSRRHLNRSFKNGEGLSIKQFLRVLRFQKLLDCLIRSRERYPAEATHRFGFYDQAHLCNEFKRMAQMSPSQFLAQTDQMVINPHPGWHCRSVLFLAPREPVRQWQPPQLLSA